MDKQLSNAEGCHEAEELVVLVQIVLRGDVVFAAVRWACEVELGGKGDVRVVERDEPKAEELGDVEVEDQVGGVVGCWRHDC